ncbi:3D-(3,5/4)-trihydroxycyclohexane-1,2-dione acylhydrolase (decyclizing), partial [Acinetobacter baumannii]
YKAENAEQLAEAIRRARGETVTTLIEIPVLAGTNTSGYESWWNVGVPQVSVSEKVVKAGVEMQERISAVSLR